MAHIWGPGGGTYFVMGTYDVPVDITNDRAREAMPYYVTKFVERVERRDDATCVRILNLRGPLRIEHPEKGERMQYSWDGEFSRRNEVRKLELSDAMIRALMNRYPTKYNERMIS